MKRDILKGVKIIVPEIFSDERGNFSENFNQKKFNETTNNNFSFVQDNKSFSKKGVFRGLHYQLNQPQGKLVQVRTPVEIIMNPADEYVEAFVKEVNRTKVIKAKIIK